MTEERRGPGRPPRGDKVKENSQRPARVSMTAGNKLKAPKREGYQRYWSITGPDHPGKLEQMQAAWWEIVKREDGTDWTIPAGKGSTHVLMEIKQEYYEEDMAAQQARNIDATQKNIQTLGQDEYVPMGQKNVVEREII